MLLYNILVRKVKIFFFVTYNLSGNDMLFLVLVESGNTFNTQVVGFSCTGCKDNFFRISFNQFGNFLYETVLVTLSFL